MAVIVVVAASIRHQTNSPQLNSNTDYFHFMSSQYTFLATQLFKMMDRPETKKERLRERAAAMAEPEGEEDAPTTKR